MASCMVYGCSNNSTTGAPSIKYYPFPNNEFAPLWVEACGWQSDTLMLDSARVCSIHFEDTAYVNPGTRTSKFCKRFKTDILREDAVPTLYLPQTEILIKQDSLDSEDDVVVYTIDSDNLKDGITTISLEDESGQPQIFEIHPSTSNIKLETVEYPLKIEPLYEPEMGGDNIIEKPDLLSLKAQNEDLKTRIGKLEEELQVLNQELTEKDKEYLKCTKMYHSLQTQISQKRKIYPSQQKAILSKVFSPAQIKILFGKKKAHWTNDEMAVGHIIRHLSNRRCYDYLTKNMNIPLPGLSSIKRWMTAKQPNWIKSEPESGQLEPA